MLTSIKSKIVTLIFTLLCVLGIGVTTAALVAFYHDKEQVIASNNEAIEVFKGEIITVITELDKNATDLALMGEVYFQKGKQISVGEFSTAQILKNYPNSMGNGIYFVPYIIDSERKISCIHAVWNEDRKIGMLPSCVNSTFDYFSQNWYTEIMKDLQSGRRVSWTRPYKSTQLGILLTTVGAGIYDQGNLVGMATVDWEMDTILKSILKIKPTPNSFVLFADKHNDYIIATTEAGIDNEVAMGKSLKTLNWYSDSLTEGKIFDYKGVKYIPYVKQLNNGLFLIVNVPLLELFHNVIHHLSILLSVLLISTLVIVSILYSVLQRNINKPIAQLTEMAKEVSHGNLDRTISLKDPSELAQLASAFNKMKTDIKTHLLQLAKISGEKEKMESELAIAHTIQSSTLPQEFPKNECFELVASMTPARSVGGDFYDFFPIDDRHYAFVMADVSGKGITAALYMMSAKTIIKNMLEASYPMAETAFKINKNLCDSHVEGMFVTAFIGVLDKYTGRVDYINAGHCPPLQKTAAGYEYVEVIKNLVLGIMPGYKYEVGHFTLKKNERLFLYTDGVTEAQNQDEKFYGEERLRKVLNKKDTKDDTLMRVTKGIAQFAKGAAQSDDITMMEIIFHQKQPH